MAYYVIEDGRAVLAVTGEDRVDFLQGLVSNNVALVSPLRSIYATLLTPQGRFLHDFFLAAHQDAIWIDCEADRSNDLRQLLSRYKLRAKVRIGLPVPVPAAALVFGDGAAARFGLSDVAGSAKEAAGGVAFVDPRLSRLGVRVLLPTEGAAAALGRLNLLPGDARIYHGLRIRAGVPDGSRDLPVKNAILLENGIDILNGVDWDKGCYVGQELTARTKYRALVKKRLLPAEIDGPPPAPGTDVELDGKIVGVTRSATPDDETPTVLALLRLDAVERVSTAGGKLVAGGATLRPYMPDWLPS